MVSHRVRHYVIARVGDLVVERDRLRPSRRLLRQGDMEASYVDLADPSHLEFDYMRWLRIVLQAARARRVLHIGGGACALPRALAAADPEGRQEVCEADAAVLEVARAHLGLRRLRGLHVRLAEGRAFLEDQADSSWDAVVVDAFVGARVPAGLTDVGAASRMARVAPLALVNVVDDRSAREVRRVADALGGGFASVWTLGVRPGNTVVAGQAAGLALDLERVAAAAAADPSPARLTRPVAGLLRPGCRDTRRDLC